MAQTIGKMLQAELDEFLGYEKYKRSNNPNSRNRALYVVDGIDTDGYKEILGFWLAKEESASF